MPIYEYQCQACGHEFEALQKIADAPLVECPACAESALKKKVSAAAFRLKGGGWYETDFKTGDKKKNLAGAEGGSGDSKGGAGDGKSGSGEAKSGGGEGKSGAGEANSGKSSDSKSTDSKKSA